MDANEWARASIDIMRLLERCGAVFHITGFDNIRHLDEPVIFISNHMSTLETMIFPVLIAPFMDVTFVVKESLVSMPLFSPTMRSRDPIVVSRANSREDLVKVISEGTEKLANGTSIVIFPQSTRREYFNPDEFNSLGVKLASRSGKRIVPMAIRTDFWKNGKLIKDLGPFDRSIPVNIKFGELMEVTGNGREEQQKIVAFVLENLKQWGAKVAERVPDHPSS
ncbi:MAG TPA: lysophospholipid acyltransferase family protein [Bacteroidales bacterium]|nr:lysophospholipid acyltransferase family protein [Bacteroidales bacterium]